MAGVIRRRSLPRRAFLRGVGAAIALPWLGAMEPALAARRSRALAAAADPFRSVFIFSPNGMKMDEWTPQSAGRLGRLPFILEPLEAVKSDVLVLSGLALDGARAHGDGPGDHARAAAAYLTCAHPVKTGGADIEAGISIDQVLAAKSGGQTPFPSLELGLEGGRRGGVCDSGYSCAYSNNIAWRTPSTPVAKEVEPGAVFQRLFGDPSDARSAAEAERRRLRRVSVLDAVLADANALRGQLGGSDRAKLDEYLTAVRGLEKRLDQAPRERATVEVPEGLASGGGGSYPDRVQLMYELIALAFQADLTRTVSFMLGNAGSNRSYRFLGVSNGHHNLSHHGKSEDKLAKIRLINRFHVEQLATFLARLGATSGGEKSLLDSGAVLFGSGIADGDRHQHHDLPIIVAGGAGGRLRGGRHVVCAPQTPLADLYVSWLDWAGAGVTSFGDARGKLSGL